MLLLLRIADAGNYFKVPGKVFVLLSFVFKTVERVWTKENV